ncbi:NAD(P)H-dependent flavin oxidoreductase [Caulobacter segnis]|uniref:NAD(P)H-dependent flavin oxidoreductase n=1 Tax=Caulobacter segnis TaxID=88688 RepID=UPI001CBDCB61|nr:nitronate monooxygenase family protein [Caulobacter segnis]UAL09779.1 nitronate monooxygenase family protein [Caulobacter segnis]
MAASNRLLDLLGVELPIIQAPMAGATTPQMAVAVSNAGGLGSLPSALYSEAELRAALETVRNGTSKPINVNFFSHENPPEDTARQAAWRRALAPYYVEAGLDPDAPLAAGGRAPFNAAFASVVEDLRPEVVSFHFGLPAPELVDRVKRTGAKVLSSATTVAEALWLEARGVDAVIAMGVEAGGHRGNFLTPNSLVGDMSTQVGTLSLVPRIADSVSVPVIAAGGIADRRGVLAAFALGAEAVQVGTAYLLTPEASVSAVYRQALASAEEATAVTNLFTGRPARGIVNRLMAELGPLSDLPPAFPTAGGAIAPLRKAAEAAGRGDFSPLWAGQAFRLARPMSSAELTRSLAGVA